MTAILPLLLAATIPLRNPFWPIGHVGEREPITDQPRLQVETPAAAAEDDTKTSVTAEAIAAAEAAEDDEMNAERLWIKARNALHIGGTMKARGPKGRQSVSINGKIYADGDLVSVNCDDYRFTWQVKGLTDGGTLKLKRIRYRELETESNQESDVNADVKEKGKSK